MKTIIDILKKIKPYLYGVIFLVFFSLIFALSVKNNKIEKLKHSLYVCENKVPEIIIEHKTDTLYDTIKIVKPVPIVEKIIEKIPAPKDSIEITQKTYKDSLYTVYVSGFQVKLDSIEIIQRMITDTLYIKSIERGEKRGLWLSLGKKGNRDKFFGIGYIVQ
ncbi:MAG: hypothetical protein BGO29_14735 [Bacteroidales bacterium 36-12]|nr:MAG: hypothetical protein BGO29_14735 [Bacteroidales bacterium 36-12]